MRGKGELISWKKRIHRITPAYAGKRLLSILDSLYFGDHPRLCGEKDAGKPACCGNRRITPAYAGKSSHPVIVDNTNKDHPRLCGEKYTIQINRVYRLGSPPPMRGKAVDTSFLEQYLRITPAYAGKSLEI